MIQQTINLIWNGKQVSTIEKSLKDFVDRYHPSADVVVYNGFTTCEDFSLYPMDTLVTLEKNNLPDKETMATMMVARHTPGVHSKLMKATVGIAGLGGLGSHVAIALARLGLGKLIIVDFDRVDLTNLNRQAYAISHLGAFKSDALKEQLREVHPYTEVIAHVVRVDEVNAIDLFKDCDVVVEAFDCPKQKAMLVNSLLTNMSMPIVAASGIAGLHDGNSIQSKQRTRRLYTVGDEQSEARPGQGLMAPRVMIAAGHQALLVAQILTDHEEEK